MLSPNFYTIYLYVNGLNAICTYNVWNNLYFVARNVVCGSVWHLWLLIKGLIVRQADVRSNISNTSDSVSSGYPNTEKRVENTTRSGVFLTKFEVFG